MKRISFFSMVSVLIIMAALIGCSSDDNPTIPNGDTNAEEFEFISEIIGESALDNIGLGLDLAFELLDSIPGASSASSNPKFDFRHNSASDSIYNVSYDYYYQDGWHIFLFSATFDDGFSSTSLFGTDSLQALVNDDPMLVPDSTMNGLKIRNHFSFENSIFGSGQGNHAIDIDATTFDSAGIATVNGQCDESVDLHFQELDSSGVVLASCTLSVDNSMSMTDVVIQIEVDEECPQSGSVNVNSAVDLSCTGGDSSLDSLNVNGNWTIGVIFNGATQQITYSDGTTTWSVTESCGSEGVAAPLSGFVIRK